MSANTLELDALVRSIEVNKGSPHALFLGAGASLTSGVPSAWTCMLQWKRNIFETKNPELKAAVSEISLPSVQRRIDDWLIANGIWPEEGEDDYGFFIERCHPIEEDRRRYFQQLIKSSTPHIGYRLLGLLAEEGIFRSVWTTNFDGLVAKALLSSSTMTPVEIGIDSQNRLERKDNTNELICVSLHGDYRYDKLKNTEAELQAQEVALEAKLVETVKRQSLIISGYSGRDRSIMTAFQRALVDPKAEGNVYWCGFSENPPRAVEDLLVLAAKAGRQAFYIPNVSFDELNIRLARQCLSAERTQAADEIIGSTLLVSNPSKAPFAFAPAQTTGLIKSNAFSLTLPTEVYSFALTTWPTEGRWKWIQSRSSDRGFNAVPLSNSAIAFGTLDQIKGEFGDEIEGEIHRSPITDADLRFVEAPVHSLVQKSLVQSIAYHRNLETNGKNLVWEKDEFDSVQQGNVKYRVHRCARILIRKIDSKTNLTIDPTFYVPSPDGDDSDGHQEARKRKLGYQHNKDYGRDLEYWRQVLAGNGPSTDTVEFDFPPNTAAFKFRLNLIPSFAEISNGSSQRIQISESHRTYIKFTGRVFPEPQLLFSTEAGWNPSSDTFPLRGLASHGPFDAGSVRAMPRKDIQLSIICPKAESRMLSQFLFNSEKTANTKRSGEYLVDFKGFSDIYRCNLIVPDLNDPNWITLPEISPNQDAQSGCRELTQNLCEALTTASTLGRSVALILTPSRWQKFRTAETDEHVFDLHDDVKAFSVRKGIATQFLDQDTLTPYDQSRIWWWLSLAIYTKAMRTPWVLKSLDPDSAFVGLGYSIDRKSDRGEKIVLGCSHIYNSQGQGLQFRLRNIQEPRIRKDRNPYLTFNEARQTGEMIRQLFWESHLRLPNRVVIHKLFPFTSDEIKGIKAGLSGVTSLELLEINHEPSLRFLSSKFQNGHFLIDGYPVKRGTALKLSSDELLLWVHGATSAINSGNTYFQGKRRIPCPVVIRRYAGTSDIATIANEILGLSKMDWNSGDLYSQLPATVHSSKTIARIGRRLAAVGHSSFDYRLFM